MAPPQLLQLADTLAKRHADKGYTGEALLLHVEVLRQQGRLPEAADLVAAAGEAAIPLAGDRLSLHASLLVSEGCTYTVANCSIHSSTRQLEVVINRRKRGGWQGRRRCTGRRCRRTPTTGARCRRTWTAACRTLRPTPCRRRRAPQ